MEAAGFIRRMFALIYDSLLVLAAILSSSLLLVWINGGLAKPGTFLSFLQFIIIISLGPIFYSYFWTKNNGQTIGMQVWKIRLISLSGKKLTLEEAIKRCFFSTLLIPGHFFILFNKNKLSLSDILSQTRIVKVKKY